MSAAVRLLLFLLPLLAFGLWLWLRRGRAAMDDAERARQDRRIRIVLAAFIAAWLAMLAGVTATQHRPSDDEIYVPPRLEDGKIVPGHFETPGEDAPGDG